MKFYPFSRPMPVSLQRRDDKIGKTPCYQRPRQRISPPAATASFVGSSHISARVSHHFISPAGDVYAPDVPPPDDAPSADCLSASTAISAPIFSSSSVSSSAPPSPPVFPSSLSFFSAASILESHAEETYDPTSRSSAAKPKVLLIAHTHTHKC